MGPPVERAHKPRNSGEPQILAERSIALFTRIPKASVSDVCTVDVRKPDVRFSAFLKHVRLLNRLDVRRCLKSGRLCPDFENRMIWEPDMFQKRRKPDVRFSDTHCIN